MEHTTSSPSITCPICGHDNYVTHLLLKDYFLTLDDFSIIKCVNCGLMITHPQPDPANLKKYYNSPEYISHATSTTRFSDKIYNLVRKKTISSKINLINQYSQGNNLLDIGCATGTFIYYCQEHGYTVRGIEPDEKARLYAQQQLELQVYDIGHLNEFHINSFDVITMWHVLEHVNDLNERLTVLTRLLKDTGVLFVALPNPLSYDAQYYKGYWAAYDVPRHLYHFTPSAFKALANKHSFDVIESYPMCYDSYYISLLSEKYKGGYKSYPKAIMRGLISNIQARKNNLNYSSIIYVLRKTNYSSL